MAGLNDRGVGGVWPELQQHYASGHAVHALPFVQHVSPLPSPVHSDDSVMSNGEDARLVEVGVASGNGDAGLLDEHQPVADPTVSASGDTRPVTHGDPSCVLENGAQEGQYPV
eukprot:127005-Rhodomonas_salina.2